MATVLERRGVGVLPRRDSARLGSAAIADAGHTLDRLQYVPYHDSYHVGQIMLLRALQGMKPIE